MLDRDLAELYGVETKRLKEQVNRNIYRFPEDFMFEMTKAELENWRSQNATSNSEVMGLRHPPYCFTEQGVAMLSSILNSPKAIGVNIQIIRIFTQLRQFYLDHSALKEAIDEIKKHTNKNSKDIQIVFQYLDTFLKKKENKPRKKIGFKTRKK